MAKTAFYAVANGRRIGVFRTWDECHILVDKFPHARYKKFSSEREAHDFINKYKITESPTSSGMEVKNSVYPQPSQSTKNHQQFNNKSVTTGEQLSTVARNSLDEIKNNNQINENRKRRHSTSVSLNSKFIKENDSVLWNGAPVVYTDGACSRNGRYGAKAGYGVFWGPNHVDNKYGPVNGAPTNNRGELQAVVVALNQVIYVIKIKFLVSIFVMRSTINAIRLYCNVQKSPRSMSRYVLCIIKQLKKELTSCSLTAGLYSSFSSKYSKLLSKTSYPRGYFTTADSRYTSEVKTIYYGILDIIIIIIVGNGIFSYFKFLLMFLVYFIIVNLRQMKDEVLDEYNTTIEGIMQRNNILMSSLVFRLLSNSLLFRPVRYISSIKLEESRRKQDKE
uniref:ribonuclease H n=1 Tax=Heterorhabditis bacteriophora TaxID=37862 RepID=A0A1I7X1M0_HETBA